MFGLDDLRKIDEALREKIDRITALDDPDGDNIDTIREWCKLREKVLNGR